MPEAPGDLDVLDLLARLPLGWSEVAYAGRRYGVTRSASVGGRSLKVYAEELGGTDVVSGNVYVASDGRAVLRPCEMSAEKVLGFLDGWVAAGRPGG